MRSIGTKAWRWLRDSRAVSALEYAILIGLMATAIAGAVVIFGQSVEDSIETLGTKLEAGATATANPDLTGN